MFEEHLVWIVFAERIVLVDDPVQHTHVILVAAVGALVTPQVQVVAHRHSWPR